VPDGTVRRWVSAASRRWGDAVRFWMGSAMITFWRAAIISLWRMCSACDELIKARLHKDEIGVRDDVLPDVKFLCRNASPARPRDHLR
jgi:hypothetical protein